MSSRAPKKSKAVSAPRRKQQVSTRTSNVTAPVAKSIRTVTVIKPKQGPKFEKRTQLLTTIVSSSTFVANNGFTATSRFRLNPSNHVVFPSLAVEAANYDEYRFTSLRAYYIPFAATATSGRVEICYDPDSQDELPVDRQALSQYSRSCASSVWDKCSITLPPSGWKFINDTNVVDRKLVDHGQLICATYGSTSTIDVGDWYLEFSIEFRSPQPTATLVQTSVVESATYQTYGPTYVGASEITFSPTLFNLFLNLSGTFLLAVFQVGSNLITPAVAGNGTLVGVPQNVIQQPTNNRTASFYTITSTGVPNATPTFQLSGMSGSVRVEFWITRCKPGNGFI